MKTRLFLCAFLLSMFGGLTLAEQNEDLALIDKMVLEHTEYRDVSLRFSFMEFLKNFKSGYEQFIKVDISRSDLKRMGFDRDIKVSEEGFELLRNAAEVEVDRLTEDLRKVEPVRDQLCAELKNTDPVALGRLAYESFWSESNSRIERYEGLLAQLSDSDREILDLIYFDQPMMAQYTFPPVPVNDEHIRDLIALAKPEKIRQEAIRLCEAHKRTRGKRYIIVDTTEVISPEGVQGDHSMQFATGGLEYQLVD